jgi:D-alanyl-D-alanine carboxypeptidase
MHNHNALLGQVKGVDGIKTRYTDASRYNLVSSVRLDDRVVGAVSPLRVSAHPYFSTATAMP